MENIGCFEIIGYFEEYVVDGKFKGTLICEEQKERIVGYYGKIEKVAEADIILENKKKIKKGQKYYTRYYPLNGKYNGIR